MRINSDGNIGIGQVNPLYKLDVYKGNMRLLTEGGGWSENGESYPTIFLSANYSAASDPAHGKISVRHSNQNTCLLYTSPSPRD